MELKDYNLQSAMAGLEGTRWENLLHFWRTNVTNQYLTFGDQVNPKQLLSFEKKSPFLFLIGKARLYHWLVIISDYPPRLFNPFVLPGAVVEGRILDRGQVQELTALPSLEMLQGELCSILQMPARKTSSLVGRQAQVLSQQLEQYMKDQSGSKDDS